MELDILQCTTLADYTNLLSKDYTFKIKDKKTKSEIEVKCSSAVAFVLSRRAYEKKNLEATSDTFVVNNEVDKDVFIKVIDLFNGSKVSFNQAEINEVFTIASELRSEKLNNLLFSDTITYKNVINSLGYGVINNVYDDYKAHARFAAEHFTALKDQIIKKDWRVMEAIFKEKIYAIDEDEILKAVKEIIKNDDCCDAYTLLEFIDPSTLETEKGTLSELICESFSKLRLEANGKLAEIMKKKMACLFGGRTDGAYKRYYTRDDALLGIPVNFNSNIFDAIEKNDIDSIKYIVQTTPDIINENNEYKENPISFAIRRVGEGKKEKIETVKILVKCRGLDLGKTLFYAMEFGDVEIAKILVENGANVNYTERKYNAVMNAAIHKKFEALEYLINLEGIDLSKKNTQEKTALHLLVYYIKKESDLQGKINIFGRILDRFNAAGIINETDINGETALLTACDKNKFVIFNMLIDRHAAVDQKVKDTIKNNRLNNFANLLNSRGL